MTVSSLEIAARKDHGIVLNVSDSGFDKAAATFGSIFVDFDDPDKWDLFYAGASDTEWSKAAIGLATSGDGLQFDKAENNPILQGDRGSFCDQKVLTPAVTRIGSRFFMVFSGSSLSKPQRRIGIAYADDVKGPWHVIGELIRPARLWEGNAIDNGPSLVKLDHETILMYYSSITSPKALDLFSVFRGYPVRRIGVLKVRIRGTSLSRIEALRFGDNPLKHLNGPKGTWNESLFCPGYIKLDDVCYLFPACSTYSVGFPYKQYVGVVAGNSPYFSKNSVQIEKLIDGPAERSQIVPPARGEIALDTPAPFMELQQRKLYLYYSVADRTDEVWKTALTTFDFDGARKSE